MKLLKKILGQRLYGKFIRKLGLFFNTHVKIRKLSAWSSEDLRTVSILKNFGITTVLDVGANVGQFAEALLDYGYDGNIVSFEPTSHAHRIISQKSSRIKNWSVAEQCALGDFDGEVGINVAENTVFSSIKDISSEYSDFNKDSKIVGKERVKVFKMDSLLGKYFSPKDNLFLKIDTQGFEQEVLKGASELLKHVQGVKIESPLLSIYKDTNWDIVEMLNFFSSKGFRCISISEVGVNKKSGIVYEVDLILIREDLIANRH